MFILLELIYFTDMHPLVYSKANTLVLMPTLPQALLLKAYQASAYTIN